MSHSLGIHRVSVFALHPFRHLGTLQQNINAPTSAVLAAIHVLLTAPLGCAPKFSGWGRACATLHLRCDDVSIDEYSLVVIISLSTEPEVSGVLLQAISHLSHFNMRFDKTGQHMAFFVLDVTPTINWYQVALALDLGCMLYPHLGAPLKSRRPTDNIAALFEGLSEASMPSDYPSTSAHEFPWLY